jgi:hypothetical protein
MGIRDWFKLMRRARNPEDDYLVTFDEATISVRHPDGSEDTLATGELDKVAISTNDSGPWGIDCWWLLFSRDDRLVVRMPQGAPGAQRIAEWLMGLPAFDHQQMIAAMSSTGNAIFPVWQKS